MSTSSLAISGTNQKTMSSIDLVKIINEVRKQENPQSSELAHSDFMKKVVKVLGIEVAGNFSCYYKAENGKENPCFRLPKRESILMVMSESYRVQAAVYDRMVELESTSQLKLPQTYVEALRALADESEAKQKALEQLSVAEQQIEADKPKVELAMAIRNLSGSCLVGEFAKVIGTGQNRLFKQLRDGGYLMANNQPYQKYLDMGWFVVVENMPFTDANGVSHPSFTTRITGKGQVALEKKFRKEPRNGLVLLAGGAA